MIIATFAKTISTQNCTKKQTVTSQPPNKRTALNVRKTASIRTAVNGALTPYF